MLPTKRCYHTPSILVKIYIFLFQLGRNAWPTSCKVKGGMQAGRRWILLLRQTEPRTKQTLSLMFGGENQGQIYRLQKQWEDFAVLPPSTTRGMKKAKRMAWQSKARRGKQAYNCKGGQSTAQRPTTPRDHGLPPSLSSNPQPRIANGMSRLVSSLLPKVQKTRAHKQQGMSLSVFRNAKTGRK